MISAQSQLRLVLIAMLASALALKQSLALAVSARRPLAQQNTPSQSAQIVPLAHLPRGVHEGTHVLAVPRKRCEEAHVVQPGDVVVP